MAHYGIGVLDQLLWTKQILFDNKVQSLLEIVAKISDGQLQESIEIIKKYNKDNSNISSS